MVTASEPAHAKRWSPKLGDVSRASLGRDPDGFAQAAQGARGSDWICALSSPFVSGRELNVPHGRRGLRGQQLALVFHKSSGPTQPRESLEDCLSKLSLSDECGYPSSMSCF